jgi:hypothetical protein
MSDRIGHWLRGSAWLVAIAVLLSSCGMEAWGCGLEVGRACASSQGDPEDCTVLTVSRGDRAFFGGNSDWVNWDCTYYWVDPGGLTGYGAIYFGRPDNVQQGFNEMGLAYDSNGLPVAPVHARSGREPVSGGYTSYPIEILRACATVEEVIAWVDGHQWHTAMHDQLHFADASGDAVVISAGPNGEIALTRKPTGDGSLVSTNFNLANPANGSFPCWRYTRAESLLDRIGGREELTVERVAAVLDAVHVATPNVWTVMSVIGDLPHGLVYVYLFHQFEAPITLNVADEITRSPAPGPLRDLFPPETLAQVDQAYDRLIARPAGCRAAGMVWLGLVFLSLTAFLLLARPGRRAAIVWLPVVVVLGPLGLLVWWLALGRARGGAAEADGRSALQQRASVETAAGLVPAVVGIVLAFLIILQVPAINESSLHQLLVDWGLPLGIGLIFAQAPLLARADKILFSRVAWRRLAWAVVSTNLAVAGLMATFLPLAPLRLNLCSIDGLTLLSWWAIAVVSAPIAGLPLYGYQRWAVRRGLASWSALLPGEEEESAIRSGSARLSWRQLVLWMVASLVVLAAGIALGAVLSGVLQGVIQG